MHLILYNEKLHTKEYKCSSQTKSAIQMADEDHFVHLWLDSKGKHSVWWCIPAESETSLSHTVRPYLNKHHKTELPSLTGMSSGTQKAAHLISTVALYPHVLDKPTDTALGSHSNPSCRAECRLSSPAGTSCISTWHVLETPSLLYSKLSFPVFRSISPHIAGEKGWPWLEQPILTVSQQCSGPVLGQSSSADPQGTPPSSPHLCTAPHLCTPPGAPSGESASGLWWLLHGCSSSGQPH